MSGSWAYYHKQFVAASEKSDKARLRFCSKVNQQVYLFSEELIGDCCLDFIGKDDVYEIYNEIVCEFPTVDWHKDRRGYFLRKWLSFTKLTMTYKKKMEDYE